MAIKRETATTPSKSASKKGSTKTSKGATTKKRVLATKEKVSDSKRVTKKATTKATLKNSDSILERVEVIANSILDKKGKGVCALDLRKLGTSICDFFVICNADSTTNVSAIADNIEKEMLEKCNAKLLRSQGKENSLWIIEDYGDIVVHVFQTQYRDFYKLEDLWSDCDIKRYEE